MTYNRDPEAARCVVCDARNPRGAACMGAWCPREVKRKVRITKEEFNAAGGFDHPDLFRLQSRGGAWRYYRRVDGDPIIFVGDGQYRPKSRCTPADLDRAKAMGSAVNVGLV